MIFHVLVAQLASDRTEDTGTSDLTLIIKEYHGIVVETNIRTVGTADLLLCSDYYRLRNGTLLDIARMETRS